MFKILVAEDDAELRQLFCRVLTRHGFQPIGAADGVEAVSYTHLSMAGRQETAIFSHMTILSM